jgi:hypothetical protein
MSIRVLDDVTAQALAMSVGLSSDASQSGIASYGKYVVYQNSRYRIDVRDGKYLASDISVYADDGTLVTDPYDVYVNAIDSALMNSAQAILGGVEKAGTAVLGGLEWISSNIGLILIAGIGLFIYLNSSRRANA